MFPPRISKLKGAGGGRVLSIATITNQPSSIMNKYVPGSGVGASSVSSRRAKLYRATPAIPPSVPSSPINISAVRGNRQVTVSFLPSNPNGSPILSYTVTAMPGNITATGTSSPIIVSGLTNGTTYTFTVIATNAIGNSLPSSTVSATPATVPNAPTIGAVTRGNSQVSVAFTGPANNGGSAVTAYTVTSNPGGFTTTGSSSPLVVTGLTNGTPYTFTVYATNAVGNSVASSASSSATPATVPSAPRNLQAVSGVYSASVTFDAPASTGGATITLYTATSNPNGITATNTSSPINVSGLDSGVEYTFTVHATNAVGNSVESEVSNAVTPTGTPANPGTVKSVFTMYDDASAGFSTYNPIAAKLFARGTNLYVAANSRIGAFYMNRPDSNGIDQILTLTDLSFVGTPNINTSVSTYNMHVIKYSSSGSPQWNAKIGGGTNVGNTIYDVVSDSDNNVYALVGHGYYGSANVVSYYNADGSVFGTISNVFGYGYYSNSRLCLVKYNSVGQIQSINTITVGDNNNQAAYAYTGFLTIDSANNILISFQVIRGNAGTGPTRIKYYTYSSVDLSGSVQFTLATSDSYPFGVSENYRGYLVKIDPSLNYSWVARTAIPIAYGEQNGGTINRNVAVDSNDNIYVCLSSSGSASSPIGNIYSAVSASTNPLVDVSNLSYYRFDLRGNSYSPSLPQYYKFAAIAKYDSNGIFQRVCCCHLLQNGSVSLDMNASFGISKVSDSLFLTMNAQGFTGTNATSGQQLNNLYVSDFSGNVANGSNYDIKVRNSMNVALAQPQTVVAIVKYNLDLEALNVTYIDTPGGNSGGNVSADSYGNIYVTTTTANSTNAKTIYEYDSISISDVSLAAFGTISTTNSNADGLVVSYEGDLATCRWAAPVKSSDGLTDNAFALAIDAQNNIYVAGTSALDKTALTNTVDVYSYDSVVGGAVQNTLFGNIDVTNATDRTGYVIKYA